MNRFEMATASTVYVNACSQSTVDSTYIDTGAARNERRWDLGSAYLRIIMTGSGLTTQGVLFCS
jgi:hypothetical protein